MWFLSGKLRTFPTVKSKPIGSVKPPQKTVLFGKTPLQLVLEKECLLSSHYAAYSRHMLLYMVHMTPCTMCSLKTARSAWQTSVTDVHLTPHFSQKRLKQA